MAAAGCAWRGMPQSGTWPAERYGGEDNEAGRGEEEKKTPVGPAGQAGPTGGGRTPSTGRSKGLRAGQDQNLMLP